MEDTQQPIPIQPVIQTPPDSRKPNTLVMGLGAIVLIGLGLLGGYFLFANKNLTNSQIPLQRIAASPTITQQPSQTENQTANWQTYRNNKYFYSIKYPNQLKTEDRMAGQTSYDPNTLQIFSSDTNIVFTVQVLTSANTSDLKTYVETIKNQNSTNANVKIGTITQTTIDNQNAFEIQVTGNGRDGGWQGTDSQPHTYMYVQNKNLKYQLDYANNDTFAPIILASFKFLNNTSPTTSSQINGASLVNIKYTLPAGWKATLNADSLLLAPSTGYLSIKVDDYNGTTGRREYYCQVSKICVEGTTKFTEMTIGNISGYMASGLDNSGGGSEYFGAKGNKFYVISSYNPPLPNNFENSYKQVLNSLVF